MNHAAKFPTPHTPVTDPRAGARTEREFTRARRHSRVVRFLKVGLPIIAALIVAGGLLAIWLARSLPDNVSFSGTSIQDGRVVMQDPRMSGVDSRNRPYELIAQRAFQSITGGGVDLEHVNARIAIDDENTATIDAADGHYDQRGGEMQLSNGIAVKTTNGITIGMDKADIDIAKGVLTGSGPVKIVTPNQTIESKSVRVADGGKILSFGGGVKLTIAPPKSSGAVKASSSSE